MELHFFPGQDLIVVKNKAGHIPYRFDAMGGPSTLGDDPRMAEQPTTAGTFIIDKAHAYRTPTWAWSAIKWGTLLMDKPAKPPATPDVWYKLRNGKWASLLKDHGIERQDVIKQHESLYGKDVSPKVPKTWIFNDFGPVAIRYFKDLNNNGKLDGRETLSGEMFHTTPDNEAEYAQKLPVRLYPSHGCIHLKPTDRDKLFSIGAFKRGTLFTVHKYTERFTGSIK